MIDTTTEQLISFAEATKLIPDHPHVSQVYRWAMRGLRGVKLEWVRYGGRRYTSREALQRFSAAQTRADGGQAPVPQRSVRKKQIATAERELEAAGFEVGGTTNTK